jgi:hypothetical protein
VSGVVFAPDDNKAASAWVAVLVDEASADLSIELAVRSEENGHVRQGGAHQVTRNVSVNHGVHED